MIMSYFLNKNARKIVDNFSQLELKSLKFKRNLFITNIISISFATYFFIRHNDRCETGGKFSINFQNKNRIISNIIFHIIFCSLYIICINGIHCGADQYGFSYDILLGFL